MCFQEYLTELLNTKWDSKASGRMAPLKFVVGPESGFPSGLWICLEGPVLYPQVYWHGVDLSLRSFCYTRQAAHSPKPPSCMSSKRMERMKNHLWELVLSLFLIHCVYFSAPPWHFFSLVSRLWALWPNLHVWTPAAWPCWSRRGFSSASSSRGMSLGSCSWGNVIFSVPWTALSPCSSETLENNS